mmetsp:Transcript_27403/g.56089  ORF Transcript_27403/g.56089 Transcript_27403/m.56089 type:complete len:854 (+) Transcript_27403:193-2754(+)|eukprot:CAMPEP_0181318190 /NCGR_PEP_ID=MMETSP1101-20121128/16876_1 /TAXON_ID=46948 /ORGANISM="Rhodomonas abbreviata, Strain Caron Lab Isolate" /LENGTH=853 /DNA_ID=CAMNT_0023425647 /DNA_START=186 /DNA_END=2747 /DNA_ORIENTATION=+
MSAPNGQTLPQKEAAVFKTIVKFYETKQYKKGLKAADSILKKFPEHGETLAMKGLTLNCVDKKTEAFELVRLGLKKNMMSHVCWHVYGLLYRSDREYKEAIKCYKQALKRDKDNGQILRDLSLLQIQMRELLGFAETRRQLLTINAKNRNNWLGFAIATHVAKDLPMALRIIEAYESTLEEVKSPDYEHSEMLMYKALILEEMGDDEGCLAHLETAEPLVLDKLGWREKRGEILLKIGRKEDAEKQYRVLLDINGDNKAYHKGLLQSRGYNDEEVANGEKQTELLALYEELQAENPKCACMRRIPLDFLTGEKFKVAFASYVAPALRKGIPSLFSDVKPLYKDAGKVALIEEVMVGNLDALKATQTMPGADEVEPPATYLWVLEFLANHFDRRGNTPKALELIDAAILYTPTVIDLHLTKARIFKHAGDLAKASDECETARCMDLADRFLNTMSVRYALRADRRQLAESIVSLFTKDGDNPNNLFDMQCMWYEIEFGQNCLRTRAYGKALKKLTAVDKHFTDIIEDQFDFHTYCLRKMTLRAYVGLLRCEDTLYKHRFFVRAALSIVETYIALHDRPAATEVEEEDAELVGLSDGEKAKVLKRRKKAAKKAEEAAKAAAEEAAKGKQGDKGKGPRPKVHKEDADPDGELLAQVEAPLEEASRYMALLQGHAGGLAQTQLLCMHLFMRKGKLLKVLQAAKKAAQILPKGHHALHRALIRFLVQLEAARATLPPAVAQVLSLELASSTEWGLSNLASTPAEYNKQYIQEYGTQSVSHCMAAAEGVSLLEGDKEAAADMVLRQGLGGSSLKELNEVRGWMVDGGWPPAKIQAFAEKARALFPYSNAFAPPPTPAAQ